MAMRSSICSSEAMGVARPPAVLPQIAVDGPVRLARAVVVRGDEGVELAPQLLEPLGHADVAPELADRRRRTAPGPPPRARATPPRGRAARSGAGAAARAPGRARGARAARGSPAPRPSPRPPRCRRTTRRRSAGRARPRRTSDSNAFSCSPGSSSVRLAALEEVVLPALLRPVRLAEDVVALHLELAGQRQQRRHAREEDARGLPRPPRPDEARRRPGRRTAASRRWWRRRRRPAAGRRRPRRPCGRRRASARSCAPNSAMRPEAFGSSESTTTGSSPAMRRSSAA